MEKSKGDYFLKVEDRGLWNYLGNGLDDFIFDNYWDFFIDNFCLGEFDAVWDLILVIFYVILWMWLIVKR